MAAKADLRGGGGVGVATGLRGRRVVGLFVALERVDEPLPVDAAQDEGVGGVRVFILRVAIGRRGVVPDVGGAWLLPRLVGMQRAKELMLLAPEIDARHAERLGLANAVEPDADAALERAVELAGQLAALPAYTVGLSKKLINHSSGDDLRGSLEREAVTQAAALRSSAATEGFEAFRAGRHA